ncbi:kinase-like domain-containing protein [Cytidiella melzeri]|nr:kinase-like domain-containing protein [Cytidiella melzeri]
MIHFLCNVLPARLRLWLYLVMSRQVPYEIAGSTKIYFFRFGIPLVLKRSDRTISTEADALKFLNQAGPHLPIPRLFDSFQLDGVTYALMSKIPGRDLTKVNDERKLTPAEMEVIAADVVAIVEELWRLPQPPGLEGKVMASASGHGLPHPVRFRETLGGPYPSILDCYKTLVVDMSIFPPGHFRPIIQDAVVWNHGDLTMRNVMIHHGRVSGIIDWEDSGWLPRHWLLHNLRNPRPGCQGIWARYWIYTHRFQPEVEEAYIASAADGLLSRYLY